MGGSRSGVILAGLFALLAVEAEGAEFFVAPDAGLGGVGSIDRPWSLQTALSQPTAVHPGDTIWLRGGTYVGRYSSYVSGTVSQPILIRQYPGERARIDGGPGELVATLSVYGQYTWFWGFEVFSSSATRRSMQDGSAPTDLNRGSPIFVAQDATHPGIKIINMVIHDGTDGISAFASAPDMEIYGNVVFNGGWDGATDRGHGHGIYAQNQTGTKKIADNIVFNNYGNGINLYGSSAASLDNIELSGNTIFGAGAPSMYGSALNLLYGGGRVADHGTVRNNYVAVSGEVAFGYGAGTSNFVIQGNFFGQPDGSDFNRTQTNLTMTENRFYGDPWNLNLGDYPSNTYYHGSKPTGTFVYVRPNAYEPGRANITVFNWDHSPTVALDVGGVLTVGAPFEVRNAQDFFATPVLSGVYPGGTLTLPMTGLTVAAPIGGATTPTPTGPEFNVFVVLTRTDATKGRKVPNLPVELPPVRRIPRPH